VVRALAGTFAGTIEALRGRRGTPAFVAIAARSPSSRER
jgi:hypothetical protein